ncbi:MAG: tRNA (adenosine(37)-N6)-threonylcarbamoyltransferase complex dimerization subunit type 1 TsaB [bacterium]|nr:tRNA (adenosine(37)-N6)-threonylcarbamoyltransferase complex dimerization subunit type 1 TsaB [bacterium]
MRSLFLNTTSSFVNIAILEDNNILYNYEDKIINDASSKIMPIIYEGFNKINFTINDIDNIFVVNGPGSFTGIRIGVTVGKTIAWALKKKIIPISSLEFLATTQTSKKYIVPLIDARRGNVFAGIYDNNLNVIKKDSLINLELLIKDLNSDYSFVSNDEFDIENIIKPKVDILKIVGKHLTDLGVNPHNLNPNYLKLTEAEENLKND